MADSAHQFSPITNQKDFEAALAYVAAQSQKLAEAVLGEALPIDTLTLFSHSPAESEFLEASVRHYGPQSHYSHGQTLYIDSDFMVGSQRITILGTRQPDSAHPQVGYADYPVTDLTALAKEQANNEYVLPVQSGRGVAMLELRHPDFDILGYIVSQREGQ